MSRKGDTGWKFRTLGGGPDEWHDSSQEDKPTWERTMHPEISRQIIALIDDIMAEVTEALAGMGLKQEAVQRDLFGLQLGVEEAVVNAGRHGSGCDPRLRFFVRWKIRPALRDVLVHVRDLGPGFSREAVEDCTDGENVEDMHGRGLHLIRHYFGEGNVRYSAKGNRVKLRKTLGPTVHLHAVPDPDPEPPEPTVAPLPSTQPTEQEMRA